MEQTSVTGCAAQAVRAIVEASGYNYWASYNDKRAGYNRIKFMKNGYRIDSEGKALLDWRIKRDLAAWQVPFKTAGWVESVSFRGPYDAYCVTI